MLCRAKGGRLVTVTLPSKLEALVQEKIESGRYRDAAQVVEEALRLLDERDRYERLRAAVAKGIEQLDRGEGAVYTPELRAKIHRAALERARAGLKPKPDVVP